MLERAGLEQEAGLREPADDLIGRLDGRETVKPPVRVIEAARLVDGREHRQVVDPPELEVLLACARSDVDDAAPVVEGHLVPRDHPVLHLGPRPEVVERSPVAQPDELRSRDDARECLLRVTRDGDPLPVLAPPVIRVVLHRGRDVRGQGPGGRRPDHERFPGPVEQGETDEERRVDPILIDAALRELVLRERRPAARAPLGRAVAEVEPAALVHLVEEAPDVLDVRVAEREVVVPPVHPLSEADRALGKRTRRPYDHVPAAAGELREPELLDLALRVEAELALDPDLDPEPLAVEPVLVALAVAAERLVPLERVLQRSAPRGVYAEHHAIRGGRAVDEAEPGPPAVQLAEPLEGPLLVPALEDLELERVVVRLVRER